MIQIENSFFALAEASERNCLIICDRGTMDASAFVAKKDWEEMMFRNQMDEVDIRDNRYNQVGLILSRHLDLHDDMSAGCSHGDCGYWGRGVLQCGAPRHEARDSGRGQGEGQTRRRGLDRPPLCRHHRQQLGL